MSLTWNIKGVLYKPSFPLVMGIMNMTPDSFYSGSRTSATESLTRAGEMIEEGADILDIGGASSRPDSSIISIEEELSRTLPAIVSIKRAFPQTLISIDTWRAEVARQCVESGADIVNDISAGHMDTEMFSTVAKLKVPYILMHMQGTPQTMQQDPQYADVVREVILYLSKRAQQARLAGIADVIIDPGFGFGKTLEQNDELFEAIPRIKSLGLSLLIGISRKSMIWKASNSSADNALEGTIELNSLALQRGADILRVHDVKECVELVKRKQQITTT